MAINMNRRGKFVVNYDLVIKNPEQMMKVLSNVLIIRAENDFVKNQITYSGFCESFDEVAYHHEAPFYQAEITEHPDKTITVQWKQL